MSTINQASLWYHGSLSREKSIQLLMKHGRRDGYFLVRDSSRSPGHFVLVLWFDREVKHFQIRLINSSRYAIDDGPIFQGLDMMISHYRSEANGLPCRLTDCCPGRPPPTYVLKFGPDNRLHKACLERKINDVKKCLSDKNMIKEINARNSAGLSALHIAVNQAANDIVMVLLEKGANTSTMDSNYNTPLRLASIRGHAHIIQTLIKYGNVDCHERSPTGMVAMHEAAMRGHLDCIHMLLHYKVSMYPRTHEGDTPRDLAYRYGHIEIIEFYDSYPVPPPKTTPYQWLHQDLDRNGAVARLMTGGCEDGKFLIRNNTECHGYHVLSLLLNNQPFHFKIQSRSDRWFYIDDGPFFETLPHLVDHYHLHMDGLPVYLIYPVAPPSANPPPRKLPEIPPTISKMTNGTMRHNEVSSEDSSWSVPLVQPSTPIPPPPTIRAPIPRPETPPHLTQSSHSSRLPATPDESKKNIPLPPPRKGSPAPTTLPQTNPLTIPLWQGDKEKKKESPIPVKRASSAAPQTVISEESLQQGPELGVGEFGSVLKGIWTNNEGEKIPVALKTLHKDKMIQGEKEFLREARVMSQLTHDCIVCLLGVCLGPPMILVQELVAMGALLDYLIDFQPEIQEVDLKLWAAQIAWGMTYLEQKRFVHRDLATRNILLASKSQVKISDFGLSRAVGAGSDYYQAKQGGRWPVKWYSPESINYGTFSQKSDVWSYGVTLWEMFTFGELPYGEMTGGEVIKLLENGQRLELPDGCPDNVYQVMLRCWHIDPVQRPTFKQLHAHFSTDPEYEDVRKYRERLRTSAKN